MTRGRLLAVIRMRPAWTVVRWLALAALLLGPVAARAAEPADSTKATAAAPVAARKSFLPLLAEEATKRGIELPLPFGAGLVYYHLDRDIQISDVRIGANGAPPTSVSQFAQLSSSSNVNNENLKLDAWLLPFLNLYAVVGYVKNHSDTRIDVTLPPLLPGGPTRRHTLTVPTDIEGSVGGVGLTLAGGYGPYFMTYDVNFDQADLGFDNRFKAVISSIRGGWNGKAGVRPLRLWASVTDWNTFATATGTVADPDGGTLSFEVDQGPAYRTTYGAGGQYSWRPWLELAVDGGIDGHGGWYVAIVPVFRFYL
jgi:hypothetical protein